MSREFWSKVTQFTRRVPERKSQRRLTLGPYKFVRELISMLSLDFVLPSTGPGCLEKLMLLDKLRFVPWIYCNQTHILRISIDFPPCGPAAVSQTIKHIFSTMSIMSNLLNLKPHWKRINGISSRYQQISAVSGTSLGCCDHESRAASQPKAWGGHWGHWEWWTIWQEVVFFSPPSEVKHLPPKNVRIWMLKVCLDFLFLDSLSSLSWHQCFVTCG